MTENDAARPSVAIAHDFLSERGGAERVLIELSRAFPEADVYTAYQRPERTYEAVSDLPVISLLGDHKAILNAEHRLSLPLAARAFRSLKIDADVAFVSTSGLAHLCQVSGQKIVYCHTPARWLHRPVEYFRGLGPGMAKVVGGAIRAWLAEADREAMLSADHVLTNSRFTADGIREVYQIEAEVLAPCSSLATSGEIRPIDGMAPGFFLTPSRLLRYKRLDVLFDAAEAMSDARFLVLGQGPLRSSIVRSAPPNVTVAGSVSEPELRWAYRSCRAVVLTSADDYGLVPDEAASFGKIAFAPDAAGYQDSLRDESISRYCYGSAASLADALHSLAEAPELPTGAGRRIETVRGAFHARIQELNAEFAPTRGPG